MDKYTIGDGVAQVHAGFCLFDFLRDLLVKQWISCLQDFGKKSRIQKVLCFQFEIAWCVFYQVVSKDALYLLLK